MISVCKKSSLSELVKSIVIFPVSLLLMSITFGGEAHGFRVALSPFKAPLLNEQQNGDQTKMLEKELLSLGGVSVVSGSDVERRARRLRVDLSALSRTHRARKVIPKLCDSLQADGVLYVKMRLGSAQRTAQLIGTLYPCTRGAPPLKRTLPFDGRLNGSAWGMFALKVDEMITSMSRLTPRLPPPMLGSGVGLPPQPPLQPSVPRSSPRYPNQEMSQYAQPSPHHNLNPHFLIWGGGRLFNRTYSYKTAPQSISLRGGISYTSRWLPGWGASATLSPFGSGEGGFLSRLSLVGEYAQYDFNTLHIIPNLFEADDLVPLKSLYRQWSAGAQYTHVIPSGDRLHGLGVSLSLNSDTLEVEPNIEYNGFDVLALNLGLIGTLSVINRAVWVEVSGGFQPFLFIKDGVEELGERTTALGAGFGLALCYRGRSSISARLKIDVDLKFYSPEGVGRNGRIGEEATDQVLQAIFELGWVTFSPPPPQ